MDLAGQPVSRARISYDREHVTQSDANGRFRLDGLTDRWGDGTGVRSDSQHGRSYAPKGKTPVIRLSAKRHSLNTISTVNNQGKVSFMLYRETMDAKLLI